MKYSFEKVDKDTTRLTYKEKSFDIRRDVQLLNDIQNSSFKARKQMIIDLAKNGLTTKDLVKEIKKDGKTLYDNSALDELENQYINEYAMNSINDAVKRFLNMSLTELVLDIGLDDKEADKFGVDLLQAITGSDINTPS